MKSFKCSTSHLHGVCHRQKQVLELHTDMNIDLIPVAMIKETHENPDVLKKDEKYTEC